MSPVTLKKVTLTYLRTEDRIRMDGESEAGDVICFWLTLRLCREVVKALAGYLVRDGLVRTRATSGDVSAFQGYLQDRAVQAKAAARPVMPQAAQPSLVCRLQVRTSRQAVGLVLPLPQGGDAILWLKPDEVRQWLEILYRQFIAGDWPLNGWPDWIRAEPQVDARQGTGPLH